MKNKLFERDLQFCSPAAPKKQIGFAVVAAEAILLFVAHSILHWSASSLTLLILGMVSVLFIFELIPIAIAALCVPVALWYAEVLPASDIFSGFCDSTVVLFGGMFVVGGAMFSTGIVSIIGSKMARIAGKNETTAMLGVMLLSAVLSSMLSNTGTVAVLMPICLGFSKSVGCSRTRLLLPLAMACSLGGLISLVGTPPNTTVNSVLTAAGLGSFGFFEFAKIGIPLTIVGIIYLLTLGRVLLPARPFEPDKAEVIASPEHYNTRKQIITLLIFIGLLIGMVLNLAPLAVLTTIAAVLCVVCGTLTESEAYGSISWSTLFLFAGMLPMAQALEVSGAGEQIANGVVQLLGNNANPYLIMSVLFLLTTSLTQFMSNTACAALLAPIGLHIASNLSINPKSVLIVISVAASCALATPMGTPPNTLVMKPGGYRFNDYLRVGLPLLVLCYLTTLVLVPVFWPLYT